MTDGHLPPGAQERAREGVQHLQAAARELIAAARAALDVAEEVVEDPEALVSAVSALAGLGELARRMAGTSPPGSGTRAGPSGPADPGGGTDDDGDEPRVQRIPVS
ncbi:MAG TPA: hypothetical protein VKZ72_00205 [Acidimicrobiales bacterium]|nr:hypothetical protein [Acidimicrobiales bacterium]